MISTEHDISDSVAFSSEVKSADGEEKRISFYGVGDHLIHDSIYREGKQRGS